VVGDGVYKSTDAGATWANIGARETGRIGGSHPSTNPNIVFACALGTRPRDRSRSAAFYRTTDGGATLGSVLFVDENTGCSSLSLDPTEIRIRSLAGCGAW